MKKIYICLMIIGLSLTVLSTQSFASVSGQSSSIPVSGTIDGTIANKLLLRLDEINRMPKANLSAPEKKNLREEVKSINKKLDSGGGVYLSVGALIVILLLLIILL